MKKVLAVALTAALLSGCATKDTTDNGDFYEAALDDAVAMESNTIMLDEMPTTVYFEFDKDKVSANALKVLNAHAEFLAANPDQSIVIEGHADAKGTQVYNLGLSQRRARMIASYLLSKGVSNDQMTEVSFGKEKLASAQDDLNRRVEIIYQG